MTENIFEVSGNRHLAYWFSINTIRNICYPIMFVKLNSISINAAICDTVHDAETAHGPDYYSIWNPFPKYAVCRASLISKKRIGFYLLLEVKNVK